MRRSSIFALALGLGLAFAPQGASAQKHGKKNDNGRDRDRAAVVVNGGAGPKFCQNGQGHPVHGRQWCIDHGFGLGRSSRVIYRPPTRRVVLLSEPQLVRIVGASDWARLERQARDRGFQGPFGGRSYYDNGTRVVTLRAGNVGIAEVILDGSGHLVRSYFLR